MGYLERKSEWKEPMGWGNGISSKLLLSEGNTRTGSEGRGA
jgi:hypothetical protein